MLLIELYDAYNIKKMKIEVTEFDEPLNSEDFAFLITHDDGKLIQSELCMLEFYFLLLTNSYDLAILLLNQSYADLQREQLNQMFIGDESNLLEHILKNPEIVKDTLYLALLRQLDGIA
jgi:hypothetical protein